MKKAKIILCFLLVTIIISGCAKPVKPVSTENIEPTSQQNNGSLPKNDASVPKIGVIFTAQGLGDKNFNDMIYEGLVNAKRDFEITFDYSEPKTEGEILNLLYEFANDGSYDLIILASSSSASSLAEVAPKYPDQRFTIVDTSVEGKNVRSVLKNGAEQTFMAGVVAALLTQYPDFKYVNDKKIVGAIIGMSNPVVDAMAAGFAAGVAYADPEVEVLFSEVGSWSDPGKAKEMAIAMYEQGVDIIQHIAGGSGTGIFAAAEEMGALAIGVGNNMNQMSTHVIGTARFNLEEYIYEEIKSLVNGTWSAGIVNPGLAIGALGFETKNSSITLPPEILERAELAKKWVVENNIVLPTKPDLVKDWAEKNIVK